MSGRDLSIAQRLGAGFAVVLLFMTVLGTMVMQSQQASRDAQERYLTRTLPITEAAAEVERQILYVAIALRSYLIQPSDERRRRLDEAYERSQRALESLRARPKDPDGREFYRLLEDRCASYLAQVRAVTRLRDLDRFDTAAESRLREAREQATDAVRAFSELQAEKSAASIAIIDVSREQLARRLLIADVLAAIVFLGFALWTVRAIRRPIQTLLDAATGLQVGNWQPALRFHEAARLSRRPPRSELHRLADAVGAAAWVLEQRERSLQVEARVASAAASSLSRSDVMTVALRAIAEHVRAEVGAFYNWEEQQSLLLPIVTHALSAEPQALRLGEGLPGEAGRLRQRLVVADIPPDAPFHLRFGIDQTPPKALVALPLVFQDRLLGVLVLASLHGFDALQLQFLDTAARQLSLFLQNIAAHEQVQQLLAELQYQNERIQAQNEELQAQSEELQAQSEELQAQNEELQAQSEELQAQQGELMARNEALQSLSERLREQQTALAEADRRKNEFLALLAHELRNPLAPIMSSVYILQRAQDAGRQDERALGIIDRQTRHLARLVEDLLDVTRISQGKIQIQRSRFDLIKVLHQCLDDCRAAAVSAGVKLALALPEGPLWIEADQTRVCQIFGNLLGNAIKFTDAGGEVRLLLRQLPGEQQVEVRVLDNGVGIDHKLLPQLFQPFMQGAAHALRGNPGLGLGLALVKALVELHGGSVEARSDGPQRGAEFRVLLPLNLTASLPEPQKPVSPASPGRRILVIDDNVDAAETLTQALLLEGHAASCAYSGEEGLRRMSAERPELVMCDIGMPGMDGYAFARSVRADATFAGCYLVALTGYSSREDRERVLAAGFNEHLAKPVAVDTLLTFLARLEREQHPAPVPG